MGLSAIMMVKTERGGRSGVGSGAGAQAGSSCFSDENRGAEYNLNLQIKMG